MGYLHDVTFELIKHIKAIIIMKKYIYNLKLLSQVTFLGILLIFVSCNEDSSDDDKIGNWIELSDFDGVPRSDAVAFTLNNKAYLGTGYEKGSDRLNDFWVYDPELNYWTQKADFPGTPRNGAVGFGINNKGYIGTGYDGENKLKDFWEYNSEDNSWIQIADFGGSERYGAVSFSIDDDGYVGTGYDGNYLKDFWKYSQISGQWVQSVSIGGSKRRNAVTFTINRKGYLCTGIDNGIYEDDFWAYDPDTELWTRLRDISDSSDENFDDDYIIVGVDKVAFSVNEKGYVASGGTGGVGGSIWEYDPITDLWEEKTYMEGASRIDAVGFGIGNRGYIATGRNTSSYFDDLWGFDPDAELDEND